MIDNVKQGASTAFHSVEDVVLEGIKLGSMKHFDCRYDAMKR